MKSKDIAKILNVSEATVSLARNNRGGVSEETRRKVMELVNRLPESAPESEQRLKKLCHVFVYRSHVSEHLIGQPTPIFGPIMSTLSKKAMEKGFALSFMFFYPEQQELSEVIENCAAEGNMGIFINDFLSLGSGYSEMNTRGLPVVVFDQDFQKYGLDCVTIDNRGAANMITQRLIDDGARQILYVESEQSCYNLRERHRGFCETMWEAGIRDPEALILKIENKSTAAPLIVERIISGQVNAVICEDTDMLRPVLEALRVSQLYEHGSPRLACCDAVYDTVYPPQSILHVNYNHEQQMEAAMLLMDQRINGLSGDALRLTVRAQLKND